MYVDDVHVAFIPPDPTETPTSLPELFWITQNLYFLDGTSFWDYRPPQTYPSGISGGGDPHLPCVRIRRGGKLRQTFYSDNYGEMDVVALARQDTCPADTVQLEMCLGRAHDPPFTCQQIAMPYQRSDEYAAVFEHMDAGMYAAYYHNYSVGCPDSEIVIQIAGVLWYAQEPPAETPTPTPVPTWLVPPSPTPRVILETPVGSSNLDTIMQQGTLVIGWVGPALFGILLAAMIWGAKVFQWLWALATWLFSGAWRGGGGESGAR